jgi:hypothetical protein
MPRPRSDPTQCLDVVDLIPAGPEARRGLVTYVRAEGVVSVAGASLVFDQPAELEELAPVVTRTRRPGSTVWPRLRDLARRGGPVLRGVVRRLRAHAGAIRRDLHEGRVTVRLVATSFAAGVLFTLLLRAVI